MSEAKPSRWQSLLLAVLLMVVGFQTALTGLLADLVGNNRRLLEETLWRVRRLEHDPGGHERTTERIGQTGEPIEPAVRS